MESGYKVHEVMNRDVLTLDWEASIVEVAKKMRDKRVGSVVLLKNKNPTQIITEQDVARKVVAEGKNPEETKAKDVAGESLVSIEGNRDLHEAMVLMSNEDIKHLPVIDNGKLEGIITAKDIVRMEPHLIEIMSFKSSLSNDELKKLFKKF